MTADAPALVKVLGMVLREQITTFVRLTSGALAAAMFLLAYGPLVDARTGAYAAPIFDGVFRFASPFAWGIGFMVPGLLLAVGAVSGRAALYLAGVTYGTFTLAAWAGMIVLEAWTSDGATITSGGLGLYVGTFTGLVGLALSPRQIVDERPIVAVLEQDAAPVPLRRIG